jgi:hypothetical protein
MKKKLLYAAVALMLIPFTLSGCGSERASSTTTKDNSDTVSTTTVFSDDSVLDTSEMFTDRDIEQSADLDDAEYIELFSGEDVTITEEGVFVLSGEGENITVMIEAETEAKVQLVLDGVSVENENAPAIYVKSADKVFVTTTNSDNVMKVTGTYEADGDTNLDAVIFSKTDLVLNGAGTLEIISAQGNGITSKDDLKLTGGTYSITSLLDGLEANDSIRIAGGDIMIDSGKDALHSENEDDSSLGYIYILDGTLQITASDDGIRGTSVIQIDGGIIDITTCTEGIEATCIQINDGEISVYATDDGINATAKSDYDVVIEVNGGTINVVVGSGDTDAFDANGSIYINGGTIDVTANSSFDFDRTAELNGGTVTVNGEVITEITESQMGAMGGRPGMGGQKGMNGQFQ